jgi:hypothetical protein
MATRLKVSEEYSRRPESLGFFYRHKNESCEGRREPWQQPAYMESAITGRNVRFDVDFDKIIRIYTVDESDRPRKQTYTCHDVRELYDWTHVQKKHYDPTTKGEFEAFALRRIEEKYKAATGTVTLANGINTEDGIILDDPVEGKRHIRLGECFTMNQNGEPRTFYLRDVYTKIGDHMEEGAEKDEYEKQIDQVKVFEYDFKTHKWFMPRFDTVSPNYLDGLAPPSFLLEFFAAFVSCPPLPKGFKTAETETELLFNDLRQYS